MKPLTESQSRQMCGLGPRRVTSKKRLDALRRAMENRRKDFNRVLDECPLDSVEPTRRIERFLRAKLRYEEAFVSRRHL